jgi:hypothetical protein
MVTYYTCPKCGYPQVCGCPKCKPDMPKGVIPYKWDGDNIICSGCGFTANIDWWKDDKLNRFKSGVNSQ